jgi:peptidoglycan hydrolase-like protein with peptidoglycan-binding domain
MRAVVAVLWVAAALVAGCAGATAAEPGDDPSEVAVATTTVTRQDLVARDEEDGALGYAGAVPLVAGRDGILTWMPRAGTVVRRGDVVAEIDGAPTRLLLGDRPAWRRLAVGYPDGPDIRQLNDNLAALGYAERDDLPNDRFDWRTRHAVSRWQDDLDLRQTGALELGDVMFLPHGVRIGTVEAQRGTGVSAGQTLANATRRKRVVTVDLDAARRGSLSEDSPVVVVLPDRTRVDATVRTVGRIVSAPAGPDAKPTVKVQIELAGGSRGQASRAVKALDAAPVVVIVERVLAEDVLTVPVGALLALAGGGYVVERVTAGGTEQVAVEPGQFADGLVEVIGDIAEGDQVVVPS